ncbi:MAG TPA: ABC transporter permease [Jatrophihabitantaceae bacterium]|jgi:osmoprotectant transport system permease protein
MSALAAALADGDNGLDFGRVSVWLNDPANWWGQNGLLVHLREHVYYTLIAVIVALLIALPLGLWIGHTGRGVLAVAGLANGLRAVPSLGLVVLLVVWLSPKIHATSTTVPGLVPLGALPYFIPVEIVLVVLAIPPILTNTYAGVQNVDPAVRDAAKGMGMTGVQVVRKVELPIALPLVVSGIRSATLQVIATATVAAYAPLLGGLGRLIIDGTDTLNDPHSGYPAMVSAGIVVAVLAVVADLALIGIERLIVSRGVSERFSRRVAVPQPATSTPPAQGTAF